MGLCSLSFQFESLSLALQLYFLSMWLAWNTPKTKLTFKVLFNLILWGLWVGLPLLSPAHQDHHTESGQIQEQEFSEHIWLELLTVVPLFYIITQFLIPVIFKRWGVLVYFGALFVVVILFFGIQSLYHIRYMPFDVHTDFFDFRGAFPLLMISGIGTMYGLLLVYVDFEGKKEERLNAHMKTELAFLRSQISPHFIFNVLNSIVYLIRTKADKQAEDVTIRLSSLMRYMLYDSDQTMVPLERELDYLRNYIDLQHMRFDGDVAIDLQIEGTASACSIEPMLLIPFVENAFKHGVSFVKEPEIKVCFRMDHGKLIFEVENKIGQLKDDSNEVNSGIGLKNVLRRLELLYPKNHLIQVTNTGAFFRVNLEISLSQNY
jgi:two-component system LytT family sensor kinase